ncbi:MAG: glutamine-hydrolyzing carbamoyl-phosphate synthase small subunit [Alphaproteobacteria bacterium]|nr:glutamine-hydrolyzing carbamoyl-phosphate synthase small subunit [Alphaproteobacteria bacterium]
MPDNHSNISPLGATAVLVLADGSVFWGKGVGAEGITDGEVVFNTSMTGYQESISDPSFAGQIITFTFPHIGNVGANDEDLETKTPSTKGVALSTKITSPSNWRALKDFDTWLKECGIVGIAELDTRLLTKRIREEGSQNGIIANNPEGKFDLQELHQKAQACREMNGTDLAIEVTCDKPYKWTTAGWKPGKGYTELTPENTKYKVVAIDYGIKYSILRSLAEVGCEVTIVPAKSNVNEIMSHNPDGVFLSNGPGDPRATGEYTIPVIKELLNKNVPIFGICLGHQMLALSLGAEVYKMDNGHRGANHPVKNLETNKVEITSQNHGFVVKEDSIPSDVKITHRSLFDGSVEGMKIKNKPAFCVQYHPESSPGPRDSEYLFTQFAKLMDEHK